MGNERRLKNRVPTPYSALNDVLRELVSRIRGILQDDFVGAYLQGSFAVGDFDEHSDVDFIVVVEEELSHEQVDTLQVMHGRIYDLASSWAQHLEGSYFPKDMLRDFSRRGEKLWYLDHGARTLIRSDHCNTLVVRRVIHEKGVVLAGPPPVTLVKAVPTDELRAEIRGVITGWGQEILDEPGRYENRFYQGFIVLNFCRMVHNLHTGVVGSKRAGAEWAKGHLDPSWAGLIDSAWACRPNPALSVRQPADPDDFASTLAFVRYAIGYATSEVRPYSTADG